MFWNSVVIAPVMMAEFSGIRRRAASKKGWSCAQLRGIPLPGAGLAMIFAAFSKVSGATGGAPEIFNECWPAGRSFCCARWLEDTAGPNPLVRGLIVAVEPHTGALLLVPAVLSDQDDL